MLNPTAIVDKILDTKLKSLDELSKNDLQIMSETPCSINYKIEKLVNECGLLSVDIATLIGESKQHINYIFRGKSMPRLEVLLKISYVLNVKLEDLYEVDYDELWVVPATNSNGQSIYMDMSTLEVITTTERRSRVKENALEFYDTENKEYLTTAQKLVLEKEYIDNNLEAVKDELREVLRKRNDKVNELKLGAEAGDEVRNRFSKRYITLYRQIGYRKTPYQVGKHN